MITAAQIRAARAILGIDQKKLAELAGVSLSTIQRIEATNDCALGVFDSLNKSLNKILAALQTAGVELIGDHARSDGGGHGVRLRQPGTPTGRSH